MHAAHRSSHSGATVRYLSIMHVAKGSPWGPVTSRLEAKTISHANVKITVLYTELLWPVSLRI